MATKKRITAAFDLSFYNIMERARKDYSKIIGKPISLVAVTRIWGNPQLSDFSYPKLKRRRIV
jgi:hypothetical protein